VKTSCWICCLGCTMFATLTATMSLAWLPPAVGWALAAVGMQWLAPNDNEEVS